MTVPNGAWLCCAVLLEGWVRLRLQGGLVTQNQLQGYYDLRRPKVARDR
jgi:hypothetical protein